MWPFIKRIQNKGFTLLEMVTVIVLLGVVSVGISGFIRIGTQAYVDVTNRDELIANGRFIVERLNRELRSALPNSVRVNSSGTTFCLEFIPFTTSSIYTDVPVVPEPASDIIFVIPFEDGGFNTDLRAAVYPLDASELYGSPDKIIAVDSLPDKANTIWEITLDGTVHFPEDSPTNRIYFVEQPVSYCKINQAGNTAAQLFRHAGGYVTDGSNIPTNMGVLMADYLMPNYNPFEVVDPSHLRNAIIQTELRLERNFEQMTFSNDVQVLNVP